MQQGENLSIALFHIRGAASSHAGFGPSPA